LRVRVRVRVRIPCFQVLMSNHVSIGHQHFIKVAVNLTKKQYQIKSQIEDVTFLTSYIPFMRKEKDTTLGHDNIFLVVDSIIILTHDNLLVVNSIIILTIAYKHRQDSIIDTLIQLIYEVTLAPTLTLAAHFFRAVTVLKWTNISTKNRTSTRIWLE
jgi:hypothetical protein